MMPDFSNYSDAVIYYRVAIRKEKDALDVEINRRLKKIENLRKLLAYNEKRLDEQGGTK